MRDIFYKGIRERVSCGLLIRVEIRRMRRWGKTRQESRGAGSRGETLRLNQAWCGGARRGSEDWLGLGGDWCGMNPERWSGIIKAFWARMNSLDYIPSTVGSHLGFQAVKYRNLSYKM